MAENPNPAPISREEFEALKNQVAEIAMLLKEQLKLKPDTPPENPPEVEQIPPKVEQIPLKIQQDIHKEIIIIPEDKEVDNMQKKLKPMEEAIKALIGIGSYGSTSRKTQNRKEDDVSLVLQGSSRRVKSDPPVRIQGGTPPCQPVFNNQGSEGQRRFENTRNREFTPLGDPLEQILAMLMAQKKITELAPPTDPKGKRYDPSKKCAYHSGSPGHDTQECWSLKHKIQNMIDSGEIVVEQPKSPNVKANPPPEHNGGGVNTIEASETGGPYKRIPNKLAGTLIPGINKESSPETVEPAVDAESKVLAPHLKKFGPNRRISGKRWDSDSKPSVTYLVDQQSISSRRRVVPHEKANKSYPPSIGPS